MAVQSPLRERLEAYVRRSAARLPETSRPGAATGERLEADEVEYIRYGGDDASACDVVAAFGEVALEYAAIRRGAGVLDCPQRGVLEVTGGDRLDFLDRMLTQKLRDLGAAGARPAFWLNRKGRIEADVLVIEAGGRTLISLDRAQAASVAASLDGYLFAEDATIADRSDRWHHLAVHGPDADRAIAAACDGWSALEAGAAAVVTIAGHEVTVARRDQVGDVGLELLMDRDAAGAVWDALSAADDTRLRPVGWYGYNTARIEAGTPLFNVDFGASNLPHESGLVASRVSFDKGCYLGQEIVARMQNLGKPKQIVTGLRIERDLLPEAGAPVYAQSEGQGIGEPVGVVTSSTLSPMLGATPVALAMARTAVAELGATLLVHAEGGASPAQVVDRVFWTRPS